MLCPGPWCVYFQVLLVNLKLMLSDSDSDKMFPDIIDDDVNLVRDILNSLNDIYQLCKFGHTNVQKT